MWKAYWLMGVLGGWVVATIVSNLVVFSIFPPIAGVLVMVLYAIYVAVAVWRCAFRVNWRPRGYAARTITVLSTATIAFEFAEEFHAF